MNMYSTSFSFCPGKRSSNRDLIGKIEGVLGGNPGESFTLDRLSDLIRPPSREDLALALAVLVNCGKLRQFISVESPVSRGGIAEFDSLDAVPNQIYDLRRDLEIDVTPDMLRALYTLRK